MAPTPLHRAVPALLALVTLTGADPQGASQEASPAPQEAPRATRHILHLRDGGVLRARVRPAVGGWEVRQKGGWLFLPTETVTRAVSERDALARARTLERDLKKDDDPLRHVAYCDWLVGEGLHAEALEGLDDILERWPDQPQARGLSSDARLSVALPPLERSSDGTLSELDRFLGLAARSGPAVRERSIALLAAEGDAPDLLPSLREELVHPSSGRRSFAALSLRRVYPGRELPDLLRRAVLDSSRDVRSEANRALRDGDDARVLGTLVRLLGSNSGQTRSRAIDSLADIGHGAAVAPLVSYLSSLQSSSSSGGVTHGSIDVGTWIAYVGDYDVEVAQGAAIADPKVNVLGAGSTLTAGVVANSRVVVTRQRVATRRALERLTGAEPGHTTKAWQRWWEEHGDEWQAAHPPPPDRSRPRTPGGGS